MLWVASNSVLHLIRHSPARVPTRPSSKEANNKVSWPPTATKRTSRPSLILGHQVYNWPWPGGLVDGREGGTVSCQRHIWANGCYSCWPSDLARHLTQRPRFPGQTTIISQPGPKVLSVSLSGSKSLHAVPCSDFIVYISSSLCFLSHVAWYSWIWEAENGLKYGW